MRKLCLFTVGFTVAAVIYIAWVKTGVPAGLCLLPALACAILFRRRGRLERAGALVLLGVCAGLLWTGLFRTAGPGRALRGLGEVEPIRAEILEYPQKTSYGYSVVARLTRENGSRCRGVVYFDAALAPEPGDVLFCRAKLTSAFDRMERGNFYDSSRGVWLSASVRGEAELQKGSPGASCWPAMLAQKIRCAADNVFSSDTAPFVKALLLGDKSGLSYQTRNELSIAGIAHAVAVSGMHVAILFGFIRLLCAGNRTLAALTGIPCILLFVLMTGAPASAVRAGLMLIFLLCAPLAGRDPDTPTSVCAALLALVAGNPWCILNAGLQMSFGATAGILLFTRRLYDRAGQIPLLERIICGRGLIGRVGRTALTAVCCSLATIPFSMPFTLYHFRMTSVAAPVTNALCLWAVTLAFLLAIPACLLGLFHVPAAVPAALVRVLVRFILAVAHGIASIPYAAVYLESPFAVIATVFLFLAAAAFLCAPRRIGAVSALGAFVAVYAVCMALGAADYRAAEVSVSALDVGQGQCIVCRCCGSVDVVDCGGTADASGEKAARFLQTRGIFRIDRLILTHYDADHVNGAVQLMRRVHVGALIAPDLDADSAQRLQLLEQAEACGVPVLLCREDVRLPFASGTLTLLAPDPESQERNNGLCVLAETPKCDILITGDLGSAAEYRLLETHAIPPCGILVAGHHGAASSTSFALLQAADPAVVLISAGKDNVFGHPAPETLERITQTGAQILRTDQSGTVTVRR